MIGLLRSDLRIIAKVWCCMGLYWSTRGCNLAAHSSIHPSFLLRKGLTRFQLPKSFLGLRIIECRNSFDKLEWGPGAKQIGTSHSLLPKICKPGLDTPRYLIAGKHRLSLLVNHSSPHHHSLGSIHLKLLSCWVESTHPFVARAVDSLPSVLLHPSGGHYCWTRCRLQMFWKPQVCVEYGNLTRQHQSGHQSNYWLCLTSVIYLIVPQMKVAL